MVSGLKFDVKSFEIYESQVKEEDKKKFNKQSQHSRHDSSKPHLTDILKNSTMKPTKDNFKYEYRIDERGKYIFPTQETTIQMIICGNQLLNDLTYEQAKGLHEILLSPYEFSLNKIIMIVLEHEQVNWLGLFLIARNYSARKRIRKAMKERF